MNLSEWLQGFREGNLSFWTAFPPALGVAVAGIVVAYALLRPLVRTLSRKDTEKIALARVSRLTFAFVVTSLALGAFLLFHSIIGKDARPAHVAFEVSQLVLILFAAYSILEILLLLFADFLPQVRGRMPVAGIFKDFTRAILLIIVAIAAVRLSFPDTDIGALLTTSAILSVVIGLALQDSLSNIFAGLMLTIDRPFKPGDWIDVDGQECKVIDSNWRSTRVITRDDDVIYVPNSTMAKSNIVNYTDPDPIHLCRRTLKLDYSAPPNKVRTVLMELMTRVDGVLKTPPTDVYVLEYGDSAIVYELWFWIENYDERLRIESDLMRSCWYQLKRESIKIPYPIQDVYLRRDRSEGPPEEILSLLKRVDILRPVNERELLLLAGDLNRQLFAKGEAICTQGDQGSTFYIIRSGSIGVSLKGPDGVEAQVATLAPGHYFGEMSLLTGEPRSSTCRALEDSELLSLDRDTFAVLLNDNPSIAQAMSEILESRSQQAQDALASERETRIRMRPQEGAGRSKILEKIKTIFRFKK